MSAELTEAENIQNSPDDVTSDSTIDDDTKDKTDNVHDENNAIDAEVTSHKPDDDTALEPMSDGENVVSVKTAVHVNNQSFSDVDLRSDSLDISDEIDNDNAGETLSESDNHAPEESRDAASGPPLLPLPDQHVASLLASNTCALLLTCDHVL